MPLETWAHTAPAAAPYPLPPPVHPNQRCSSEAVGSWAAGGAGGGAILPLLCLVPTLPAPVVGPASGVMLEPSTAMAKQQVRAPFSSTGPLTPTNPVRFPLPPPRTNVYVASLLPLPSASDTQQREGRLTTLEVRPNRPTAAVYPSPPPYLQAGGVPIGPAGQHRGGTHEHHSQG